MACFRELDLASIFANKTVFHHAQGHVHPKSPRAQIAHFRYLRKNSMDCCSVEHCMMPVGIVGELTPRFRSLIGHDDDQVCNIHYFAPLTPPSWHASWGGGANGENVIPADHVGQFQFLNLSWSSVTSFTRTQQVSKPESPNVGRASITGVTRWRTRTDSNQSGRLSRPSPEDLATLKIPI